MLVGKAVDPKEALAAAAAAEQPAWRSLRDGSRANDPRHNPILQRNIKAKAKAAEQAALRKEPLPTRCVRAGMRAGVYACVAGQGRVGQGNERVTC